MKILVIGASGFIGRALVERLLGEGHDVDAWDRRGGAPAPRLRRQAVDLLGAAPLPRPDGSAWDAAFHLAAHAVPGLAWHRELVMENLAMTARVLDHLCECSPGCMTVVASSSHVYAPSEALLDEDAPVAPHQLYGLSKQLCECWAQARREQLHIRIVRPFNQIGPGMPKGLLVTDVLERARAGEATLVMRGRNDWKDFLDWRDAIDAYVSLLRAPAASGSVWNLCSGRRVRVSELIAALLAELGIERRIEFADARVESLIGDASRLMKATGWAPRRTLQDTVRAICAAEPA